MQYPGQIPLETDPLGIQRNMMIGLGWALQGSMGTGTFVDGFTCVQTTVPSQQVQVTPGQILSLQNVDASAYSSLPADTVHQIVKQGLMLNTATFTCAAPLTTGQSVNYLIECAYQDVDGTPVVLPYYNASNPSVAWSGPGGLGTAQNTVRQGLALVQIKTGVAATTGTQVTPTPDAGFVGMFVVTVAFGQTTITSTSISAYAPSSFIPAKLTAIPAGVQNGTFTFGAAGGTVNAYTLTTTPASTALVTGAQVLVFFGTPNTSTSPTLNRDGLGAVAIVKSNGSAPVAGDISGWIAFVYDGTSWRARSQLPSDAPLVVTANVTLYVRTDGNDSNTGSANNAANAFLTIPAAINYGLQRFSFGAFGLTIQLGNTGTYGAIGVINGAAPTITVRGDPAAQDSYIISGALAANSALVNVVNGSNVSLVGVNVKPTTVGTSSSIISSGGGASVTLTNVTVSTTTNVPYGVVASNGVLTINAGCKLSCNTTIALMQAQYGGLVAMGANIAIPSAVSSTTFCAAVANGSFAVSITGWVFTGAGIAGSTGNRYAAILNGVINTSGGGANFFPGSVAGAVSTGGQYQ